MKLVIRLLSIAVSGGVLAAVLVYSGAYNIAADEPHWEAVYRLIETVRDRSIAVRAGHIQPPEMNDPARIARGAKDYAEMCVECHLAPGIEQSEIRQGLYPKPPKLTEQVNTSPAELFWVIKHGIKMTAMPAWGPTHEDARLWDIVTFVRKLPSITPEEYQMLVDDEHPSDQPEPRHRHRNHHGDGGAADASQHHQSIRQALNTGIAATSLLVVRITDAKERRKLIDQHARQMRELMKHMRSWSEEMKMHMMSGGPKAAEGTPEGEKMREQLLEKRIDMMNMMMEEMGMREHMMKSM
jgi:mono/diheme cytochrome c family protein